MLPSRRSLLHLPIHLSAWLVLAAGCGGGPKDTIPTGIPDPLPGVYVDFGPAPREDGFRATLGFPTRDPEGLQSTILAIVDPQDPAFRQALSPEDWIARYAPPAEDVAAARSWLEAQGLRVTRVATNRLLLAFEGTVGQFNDAFQVELHSFERENPSAGNPPIPVYGVVSQLHMPPELVPLVTGVVTCDLPVSTKELPGEGGEIDTTGPEDVSLGMTPPAIASHYGLDDLYAQGIRGEGEKVGLVVGATFKFKDLHSFWGSFGITRADPVVVEVMEPPATRYTETTLDVEWTGAMAPGAELRVYEGPDARNTSILYTFNEAIALNEVPVLATAFAHREDSEESLLEYHFSSSARMGAAMGMTIAVAGGDSARPDIPSTSPFVTCVGGTKLLRAEDGSITEEIAWENSGSGVAQTLAIPVWQEGVVTGSDGHRAVSDIALNASVKSAYWMYYLGQWKRLGGTSFAAPVFGGLMAVVNHARTQRGLPPAGYLNPPLYQNPKVQAAFRDVVKGGTDMYDAGPGWDYPTGWGSPLADRLADALP